MNLNKLIFTEINIEDNKITLKADIEYKGNKKKKYKATSLFAYFSVPINHPEYNEILFMQKLYNAVSSALFNIEMFIVWDFPEYIQEEKRIYEKNKALEKRAKSYAKERNIEDPDIIDSIIEVFQNKYVDDCRVDIISKYQNKILLKERLLFASFSNYEKKVKELSEELNKTKVSKSTIEVWLRKQADKKIEYEKLELD